MVRVSYFQRQKYEQLTIPIISVLFVLVLTALVVVPQFSNLLADKKQINQLKEELANLDKKSQVLANLDAAELNIKTEKLYRAIPADQDLAYYILAIRSMARRSGVQFTGIDLGKISISKAAVKTKSKNRLAADNTVQLAVMLKGQLQQLKEYLNQIETSIPLVIINEFSFSQAAEGGNILSAKLVLDFYFLLDPDSLGKLTDPVSVITAADNLEFERIDGLSEPEVISLPRVPVGNTNLMP